MAKQIIFLDTETTGLLKPVDAGLELQPYITEICLIKIDEDENFIDQLVTFIKPPIPISEDITKITGISDDTVKDAPNFRSVYGVISDFFLGADTSVAHNSSFDMGMLKCELMRYELEYKFPWPKNQICTVEKSFAIKNRRLALGKLHKIATGKDHENAHRAEPDVHALIRCYMYLKEKGYV